MELEIFSNVDIEKPFPPRKKVPTKNQIQANHPDGNTKKMLCINQLYDII